MFAYCLNNPIYSVDPYGYFSLGATQRYSNNVSTGLCGDIAGVALAGGILVAGAAIGSVLAETFDETVERITVWVDAQVTQGNQRDNSVYVLKDPGDGNLVKYVGRTNDPIRRLHEHQNDPAHPWRQNYTMTVLHTGLTKDEAMLWEQIFISTYTLGYLENARREIAAKNVGKYQNYMGAATEIITGLPASELNKYIAGR